MTTSLKKKALALLFPLALFAACKKESNGPSITSLNTDKEKIAVGQYLEITSSVTDKNTDAAKLIYSWSGTDGFKSSESVAKWTPAKSGNQSITLTVTDGDKSSSKTKSFVVANPDFRLALWGNSAAELQLYETKAGKYAVSKSATSLIYPTEVSTTFDLYYLTNSVINMGATAYTKVYTSDYDQYITDYNTVVNTLKTKFGNFESSKVQFRTEELYNQLNGHPELLANAIMNGDAMLLTVWQSGNNTIQHILLKSSTNSDILLGTIYGPKTTVSSVSSSTGDTKARTDLEKLFHLVKP